MTASIRIALSRAALFVLLCLCLALAACSTVPNAEEEIAPSTDTREAIASLALEQLDAPYQANAAGPKAFDNSGLTYFAYHGAGAELPRETQAQLDAGKPIDLAEAQPADLLFFRVETANGGDQMLVGLYTQTAEMLMAAPNVQGHTGVSLISLDDEFWQQRLVGVIRLLP
ncbi:C40 family peptidase [Salinisphaera aquimarina]|uniref:C40 family peptidase n=1 Tax=Salinisphaera aquimarina TaxID=2094031 RepID=A0ABV7EJX6_9GAMM